MKRIVMSLVLCLTLATTLVLTSCGGSDNKDANNGKTLRVAMECGYAPYNWTQKDDSNGAVQIKDSNEYAYGYDVMMAKKIADELGMKLEIVKLDWDSLVPALQSGKVDCVIAGQSITTERLQSVDFSNPYYYATIVTLTKSNSKYANAKGVKDLNGATATSQINTVWYDVCLPQIPNINKLPAQENAPVMLATLNSGKADLVVTDMPTAKAAVVAYPDLKLLDFAKTNDDFKVSEEEINIGISVQKGNTELKDKINKVLEKMTAKDFDKMMDDAIKVQPLSNK
ncbi:MAG: transporter substrate-binding domain-containing protein [Eubacteriales bacterium]|nr:transporter substrate-binding domain-containing protein [Eubacteriales bacterium]MDY3332700.1 transporter substrate-binding domain-containing protein [Gallibacter sp.]